MRIFKSVFLLLILSVAAYPQTQDLGLAAFSNDQGDIMLAADASLAVREMDNPYVMFVLYLAAKSENQNVTVNRKDVVMVYLGQEYKMPSVEELRKNYGGQIHDVDFYRHLGKEGIYSAWVRFYKFTPRTDFFPPLSPRAPLAVDEGSMYGYTGFMTKCYFKNPGFKKGDKITIRVRDKNNPQLMGEVEVVLK